MPASIHKELVACNDTKQLVKIRELVKEVASTAAFAEKDLGKIVLAVDEAVANIMEHAYEEENSGEIWITLDADESRFEVMISDRGQKFDPSDIDVPNIQEHVKMGKKKGLGIFLMRQIMDEVKYTFVQGLRNELRMVKYVQRKEGD